MRPRPGARRRAAAAAALAVAILGGAPAAAAEGPQGVALSAADAADVRRIEDYLNGIGTLKARFLQVASDGSFAEGDLYIARPGRLRMEYDPPVPILIVANGRHLIYHDSKLEQVSYLGLSASPAAILLDQTVALSGKLTITGFDRGAGTLRVTMVQSRDPEAGSFTLVFSDRPMTLKKWVVRDAQGITITVSLLRTRFGMPLNPDLFRFEDPTPAQSPH